MTGAIGWPSDWPQPAVVIIRETRYVWIIKPIIGGPASVELIGAECDVDWWLADGRHGEAKVRDVTGPELTSQELAEFQPWDVREVNP